MKRKKILSIEAEGLSYKDEQGTEKFIDFASAAYFYSKLLQEWNGLDEKERITLERRTKCVALRDGTAKPIYVKFLAETPVIFEFER
ncbi:hypothetical protein QWJ34_22090 [Saccharibacillus sp. CPCC 101409]|uniref:hypothetical protein n=1 Tax=Saccharibacillus sp. CPCC 101409 TaxID=3058041 RepID=UPI0026715365|nr:hypothetical protein [Saccharibacillus sp. CPCC 101409]MDO3412471.1 hypothetical protein [Saccharibacillus sp. CPCC 101409]